MGFVAGFAGDEFGGFGGADGFASVAVCFALGEELEDGGFEGGVFFSRAVAASSRGSFARSSGRGACRSCRVFLCVGWGGQVWVFGQASTVTLLDRLIGSIENAARFRLDRRRELER